VNEDDDNRYNTETRRLLKVFADKGIRANGGNNIFPSGNALKNLPEYFAPPDKVDLSVQCDSAPYTSRLDEISCFGINPNGDVNLCSITIGNIYADYVLNILDGYDPYQNPVWRTVLEGGVSELARYAKSRGIAADINDCRSACGICRKVMAAVKAMQL
jgi:hypothetical protein